MDYFLEINMNIPFFTIITACFNSEKTINDTIQSVLNQNYTNFEYILVDGKSTDTTVEIIKSFDNKFKEKGISYKWISEKDTGIYNAFNKGIKLSKGNWISFLGSDDVYLKKTMEIYNKEISNLKNEADFVYSNITIKKKIIFSKRWKWNQFRRKMTIAHVGGFHHKNYFENYGFFNEGYKIAGDYELLLRAKQQLKTHQIDEVTVIMADEGISNSQIKNVYLETTRAKVETGKVSFLLSKFDYFIWMQKYRIKKIIYALVR
jgi:glycosyltransferase involved in cell wall biosynthesis